MSSWDEDMFPDPKRRKVARPEQPAGRQPRKLGLSARSLARKLSEPEGPFANLLSELLEQVLSYLPVEDKGRAACVCRHWRRVCYSRFLWENEFARIDLQQTSKRALRSIKERGITRIQVISFATGFSCVTHRFASLHTLRLTGCCNTTDGLLKKAFSGTSHLNLKECDLSICYRITDCGLRCVVSKAPNIEKLNLAGCINISNEGLSVCCTHCKNLRSLNLTSCKLVTNAGLQAISRDGEGLTELQELNLEGCNEIRDSGLLHISHMKQLESLVLRSCSEITNEGIAHLAHGLHRLKHLNLSSCRRIGDGAMYSLASNCRTLECLDVSFCPRIRDSSLSYFAQGLPKLLSLQMTSCSISDAGIHSLAQSQHGLKHLSIGQCLQVTDSSLGYISEYMGGLESIDLYGCVNLSSEGLKEVLSKLSNLKQLSLSLTY